MQALGLYLHVPFCRSKCLYCDFCSFPHRPEADLEAYTEALCRDLAARAPQCRNRIVDTVYVGGGTPTVLPPALLTRILNCVHRHYAVAREAEITVECNPVTGSRPLFDALIAAGANRLSIGVQSVHERELRALGRLHRMSEVEATFRDARAAGFTNLSVDVMSGIPHQTRESYLETLDALCALEPAHISSYGLIVEEGTPFARMGERLVLPDEEEARALYFLGIERLQAHGYRQYEISNFARPGYASRHNLKYWNCEEYLGIGPSAHSFIDGKRFFFERDITSFINGEKAVFDTAGGDRDEYIMLRLRLSDGICFKDYQNRFGKDFPAEIIKKALDFEKQGLMTVSVTGIALTTDGFLISNYIISELIN
jgi:oxygen-independent coproporphyrinogen-3 oxidase